MKKHKITAKIVFALAFLFAVSAFPVSAEMNMREVTEEPMYDSFTYAVNQGKTYLLESPSPYRPVGVINGNTLGTPFSSPSDIYVDGDEIYITDKAGNSVIITDGEFRVKSVITGFAEGGKPQTFSEPLGVCSVNGLIYIADSGNRRVVVLNRDGSLNVVIKRPDSPLISDTLEFIPQKVSADAEGRIYVIAKGVYEGIMEFFEDGTFGGFVGSIPVTPDPLTVFWKRIMTKEQSNKLENFVPVEYTNMELDEDGYIYTVSLSAESQNSIRKLNAAGSDILIREALGGIDVCGAISCENADSGEKVSSNLEDIAVTSDGTYYVLDSKYGRIYAYDNRGNMLFAFGSVNRGQNGMFVQPTAIAIVGDSVCVSDSESGCITVFRCTDYASSIFKAKDLYRNDQYTDSIEEWNKVLQYNGNFTLAYSMIGKSYYQLKDYRKAMKFYRTASDQAGYSKAFARWRDDLYSRYFLYIILGIALLIGIIVLIVQLCKRYRKKHPDRENRWLRDLSYPWYVILHPFDGFWDLKNEKRGRIWVSTLLIGLTILAMTLERGLTGFAISATPGYPVDLVYELKLVLVPIALFLVGNMSITTLMDGKGSFKDLYIATGYALLPFLTIKFITVALSNLLSQEEAVFTGLLSFIALFWTAFLLFSALLSIHEYTAGKTAGTIVITAVAMVIICFICVLFFSLFSELTGFVYSVIRETRYR